MSETLKIRKILALDQFLRFDFIDKYFNFNFLTMGSNLSGNGKQIPAEY